MPALLPSGAASPRLSLSLECFLRLLLLRGSATRADIGRHGGFSPASVTMSSQWLAENGFLEGDSVRVATSKRPVEVLSLRVQPWVMLAIRVSAHRVVSDLLDSTGAVLESFSRELPEPSQRSVYAALGEELAVAQKWTEERARPIYGAALSVDGTVSEPGPGVIFHLRGLPDWVPCAPRFIHPMLMRLPLFTHWTRIVCKLFGLAQRHKTNDKVAYFEVDGRALRVAALDQGVVILGRFGTSGSFLHQTVLPSGPECFCGRPGCLDALLRSGQASAEQLFGAIQRLVEQHQITHLGIEWPHNTEPDRFSEVPLQSMVSASDGADLERRGLALLATEAALLHQVDQLQRTTAS